MKNACKSICLGVQDTTSIIIIMLIAQAADAILKLLRDVINLSTPILQAY